jgi:RNA polymerase sigma factor (sigma-70 family)
MTTRVTTVLQHLRSALLAHDMRERTDAQLLEGFVNRRETTALEALVSRHAAMVWGVCRRFLVDLHDVEDAFQATFLVLVRKAASVSPREMVGNWLYGVARQTALKARERTARRRARERQVEDMPQPAVMDQDAWRDLAPLLDEELSHLPDKYRAAIIACDLEGKTRKRAAQQLGCPEGTLAARLARGRVMLAKRLAARGLAVSGGALAGLLSQRTASAAVPGGLLFVTTKAVTLVATGQAAAGVVSAGAVALAEGVVKVMLLNKLKIASAVLLVLAVCVGGAIGLSGGAASAAGDEPVGTASPTAVPFYDGKPERLVPAEADTTAAQAGAADRPPIKTGSYEKALLDDWEDSESVGDLPLDLAKDAGATLDGLWEDVENKGAWFHFQESTIRWHPARLQLSEAEKQRDAIRPLTKKWTCRYALTCTPMTIDVFQKDGTRRGIYVVERATLFVALAKIGKDRPTSFQRDDATTLWVLKRVSPPPPKPDRRLDENEIAAFYDRTGHPGAAYFYRQIAARRKEEKGKPDTRGKPVLEVRAMLERIDTKNSVITGEMVNEKSAASILMLLARRTSDKPLDADTVARAVEHVLLSVSDKHPKVLNIPVRPDAAISDPDGAAIKLKDLRGGRLVSLQLAADPVSGLVIVGIQVLEPKGTKKP